MQLENFIQFIIRHNALLIQSLVGVIVFFVLFLAYRSFLAAKEAELHPDLSPSLGNLEETLKKLLEKANQVPATGSAEAAAAGPQSAALAEEINELKKNLEAKQAEIENLKTAGPAAGGGEAGAASSAAAADGAGMSSEEKTALENQLRELQAKLAEYEIISEDIADLSFYKEENAKLQKQLEGMKGGASAPAAPAPEAAAPVAPPAAAAEPPPVAAAPTPEPPAPVVAPPPPLTPAPAPVESAAPAVELSEMTPVPALDTEANALADADIMKEFEMAVEEQAASAPAAPTPAPAAPAPAAVAAVAPEAAPVEPSIDLGTMDMDKMLAEATGLEAAKNEEAINALEASTDPDKLIAEAASMGGVKPDDAQLMGQFEDFVKKGGS